jgi:hypothetical protein
MDLEAGASMQVARASGFLHSVGRKHIAEGASCESNSSWLPMHKIRLPADPLLAATKHLQIPQLRVVAEIACSSASW